MYAYIITLTVDPTKVSGSHSDFPVLVDITHNDLRTVANGGKLQNGPDFNFYPRLSYGSSLKWELESYSATTGRILAHVRVPSVSDSVAAQIDLLFGDASISTSQADVANTWLNYNLICHFGTPSSLNINSSIGSINGTNNGGVAAATGKIGGAANFAGGNRYLTYGNVLNLGTNSATIECWANFPIQASQGFAGLFTKGDDAGAPGDYYGMVVHTDNHVFGGVNDGSGSGTKNAYGGAVPSLSTWHHFAQVINKADNTNKQYVDGVEVASVSIAGLGDVTSSLPLNFGTRYAFGSPAAYFTGMVDEGRISVGTARTQAWLATCVNSQGNPATFLSMGSVQPFSVRRYWMLSGGDLGAGRVFSGGRL